MNTVGTDHLEPNRFYWARRLPAEDASIAEPSDIEVVQISTVFGSTAEFWTVAVMGSDEHFAAFEFFHKVPSPPIAADKQPKLYDFRIECAPAKPLLLCNSFAVTDANQPLGFLTHY
jgi:hypothetical protein